jgi:hypothetical protein
MSVTVAVPPLASVPRLQLTGEAELHVPCDGVAETNVRPGGSVSRRETLVAGEGPLLWTVIVYVSVEPFVAIGEFAAVVSARSALAGVAATGADTPCAFPELGSNVELAIDALLLIAPLPDATRTTSVNEAAAPFASDAAVHVIVPVAPIAGVVQLNPDGVVIDWN